MTSQTREGRLAETFVALADTLVVGFEVVELLHTLVESCASLFDAVDAGIILADESGDLEVMASTNERSHLIELLQLRAGEGPCVEAYVTGKVVSVANVAEIASRWPRFEAGARSQGYASIHSIPLRLRSDTIGSLNLFRDRPGVLSEEDAVAAQALADVATIGILQERLFRENDVARQQLQYALESRIVIEQAKGVIAQTRKLDMDESFKLIRSYARSNGKRLDDVAKALVDRTLQL